MFSVLLLCAAAAMVGLNGGLSGTAAHRAPGNPPAQASGPSPGLAIQAKEGHLGSAGYLRGDVLLVSLYVDDRTTSWDEEKQADARSFIDVACTYLEAEAADYGEQLNLYYDVEEHPDLLYHARFEGKAEEDMGGQFSRWLYRWIDTNVPVAQLQQRYGTDNVGFLALVADEGGSYTNVYYAEDSTRYYNESSVLFYYYSYFRTNDREVPAVYAHEILHMFGAIDLYEDSPDFSPENIAYMAQTYPDDIMHSGYTEDGRLNYKHINLDISPVTAYYLGWLDQLPEADQAGLTDYERRYVAGFSYDDPVFEAEGGK